MYKTIVRRLLIMIPQLFIISLFIFALAYHMPGDALTGWGEDPTIDRERLEQIREEMGLNAPWYIQYQKWITNIVTRLDFGRSHIHARPVTYLIGERAVNTFWLALMTLTFTYMIAIPLGIIAGRYNDKFVDKAIGFYTYLAFALPTVVFALIMVLIFGYSLQWFPRRGSVALGLDPWSAQWIVSRLYHMFLPAITAALLSTIGIIQYLRGQIVSLKYSDFVITARSKGVPESVVYTRHILRNALIPIASGIGFIILSLLTGSIFIETIFSYPGMGSLFIESINMRDFAVVNALVVLFAVLTVIGSLLSDIILTIVDPRIRIR